MKLRVWNPVQHAKTQQHHIQSRCGHNPSSPPSLRDLNPPNVSLPSTPNCFVYPAIYPPNTLFPDSIEAFEIPHIQVVAMSKPVFWSTPLRYMRWAANERPAIFYSILMGSLGPVALVALPPIRRYFGDVDPAPVPMSYPIPPGPRKIPQGYDDE
ncbi:hypothetical protein CIHG_01155 [Coccidioides immitis H538.4]|nr:hypothetical protein CIRG_03549 [Coccidioides immitis RMSCC 2394]KMU74838.1 hypothetical protein CISG_00768 [Coccidioides immitis RMSCC 3703]KMU83373.1 hypothetical protein CIHG_01155 [Coccidioides immitis H538.4]